jgi:hypothetical protein
VRRPSGVELKWGIKPISTIAEEVVSLAERMITPSEVFVIMSFAEKGISIRMAAAGIPGCAYTSEYPNPALFTPSCRRQEHAAKSQPEKNARSSGETT